MSKAPTVVVSSKPGHTYQQVIQAGIHKVVSDVSVTVGGSDQGPTPHELFLGALGACTAMTMQMVARRKGWDLQKVTVTIIEDRVEDPTEPGNTIPCITEQIVVDGKLSQSELAELEAVAARCPVYKLFMNPKQVIT
ncbi:MAG: OsmC family protein, partial [Candidatus Melainabacteria bacterium]|nr:OsmC family protein [Candidatus Melainabacteria bacterium]